MKDNKLLVKKDKLFSSFTKPKSEVVPETLAPKVPTTDWRNKYSADNKDKSNNTDDSISNQMIQLKNVDSTDIIEPKNGKMVYDTTNKCVKVVVDGAWVTISTT